MTFSKKISNYFKAGYSGLAIRSHEESRVLGEIGAINTHRKRDPVTLYEWDCIKGLRGFQNEKVDHAIVEDTKEVAILLNYLETMCEDKNMGKFRIFVLKDFHMQLDKNPVRINYIRQLRNIAPKLRSKQFMLIFLSPLFKIPSELEKEIQAITFSLPDEKAISASLDHIMKSARLELPPENPTYLKAVEAAKGMSEQETENAFSLGIVVAGSKLGQPFIDAVFNEKIEQVRKNGLLEHIPSDVSFDNVGGLTGIKNWSRLRNNAFSKEAREFGIPYPKGILLAGVPGTGKTLIAKAISREFGCPLFKIDLGGLFSKMVGETEHNFIKVTNIMDSLGQCVVLLDEVEKYLNENAVSGAGDTGTSSRSFGTFLTWMQDRVTPVFLVCTSNDHTILPAALIRKGRLDELFWVDLPTSTERMEIFDVVIRKFKRDPSKFDIATLSSKSNQFSGAEIEEVIKLGLYRAFSAGHDLQQSEIESEIRLFKPYAKMNSAVIEQMRIKAKDKLKVASESGEPEDLDLDKALRSIEVEEHAQR